MKSDHGSGADRVLIATSAAVALVAVVTRVYNVSAYPAMWDWDAAGHAVNVVDLMEGHLPDPRSWCGSHPPLFYALSAALAGLLPTAIPIHVTMRLVSSASWIATVALVWRSLRRSGSAVDAAVVAALLLGIPGLTIASSMTTNDALCALFGTLALVRLMATPRDGSPTMRDVAVTGVLAALAAATKATGVAIIGIAALSYVWWWRHDAKRAVQALVVLGVVSVAIAGPHYVRLFWSISGSPYDILAVRAGSQEKETVATFVHAVARENMRSSSLWALFHAAIWADPTKAYLPIHVESLPLARALWFGGLLVPAVFIAGVARMVLRRDLPPTFAAPLLFGAAFTAALVPHALDRPYIILTKTNYILPEALPLGIVLALGLEAIPGHGRTAVRTLLLALAAGGVALTIYGWWEPTPRLQSPTWRDPPSSPALRAVERYFEYRLHDPIRAVQRLGSEVQLAHDLRVSHLLGLPSPPEATLASASETSAELAQARVAWLEVPHLARWMLPILSAFDVHVLGLSEQDGAAIVRLRIGAVGETPPAGGEIGSWPFPPFDEELRLERPDGDWRITRLAETGDVDQNAVAVFSAHPTAARFDHLRALGWRPPLEGVAAKLGMAP